MGDGEVKIELDGAGLEPTTVDARSLLDLASAFLDIIERVADEEQIEIAFRGISVENKCVALVTHLDSPSYEALRTVGADSASLARELSEEAINLVSGVEPARRGLETAISRARAALNGLPEDVSANVIIGPWKARIAAAKPEIERYPTEATELRATPLRIGGRRSKVRFASESEAEDFTVDASADLCRRLGPCLYREVDIYVRLRRTSDGRIEGGILDDFAPVDQRDKGESLRAWFSESAAEWGDVTDVLRELDRRD